MSEPHDIDGVLVQWGDRLFYPANRIVKAPSQPKLSSLAGRQRAAVIRARIEATVVRRAPQVMVKVTGGGRGMKAIAAHFRYISKRGRLEIEDDQGSVSRGKDTVWELAEDWRFGGSLIPDVSTRREAFNVILSMPRGTDPNMLYGAARDFARSEFAHHKYVMVLHDHQANPHVHLSVRAESKHGKRLNPRKADLHRWRETFAEKLQGWGIDAEASRQASRGVDRNYPSLWRKKAAEEGRERKPRPERKTGRSATASRREAGAAWARIAAALRHSADPRDRASATAIERWAAGRAVAREVTEPSMSRSLEAGIDKGRSR
jgi:hypothetical protein